MELKRALCIALLTTASIALAQTTKPAPPAKKPTPAQKNPIAQLPFADARNMTLMIYFADPATKEGFLPVAHSQANGSGVWIGKTGYVATCHHVIKDWHGPFKIGFARSAYVNEGSFNVTIGPTVNVWDADLVAADPDSDVAILRAHIAPGKAPPMPLVSGDPLGGTLVTPQTPLSPKGAALRTEFPNLGETLLLAGYPLGHRTLILQTGTATGVDFPPIENPTNRGARGLRIFLSLVSNPGNSGGPVLDADGKVIGLLEGNLKSPIRDNEARQVLSPTVRLNPTGEPVRDASGQLLYDITPLMQNSGISLAVPARFIAELAKKNNIDIN